MNPESITVDLEHAKMLKEAGWPQAETIWYWFDYVWSDHKIVMKDHDYWSRCQNKAAYPERGDAFCDFAAPTAEEILRRLPQGFEDPDCELKIDCMGDDANSIAKREWFVSYENENEDWIMKMMSDSCLANAAASMWCYLKKNGLLQ
jgi:hypothetical protein